jgi:hypothetical protein
MRHYYSTQPFLAWCLNRHFYEDVHYAYVAPFYPYRLTNPKSSNPLELYRDLYQPWRIVTSSMRSSPSTASGWPKGSSPRKPKA